MPVDYKRYHPDWKTIIVPRIRKRDNYKCTVCGKGEWEEEKEPLPGSMILPMKKVVLTTAHLDHDETNWDCKDERLATMCPGCHLRYDRYNNKLRKAYGKHYRETMPLINFPPHDDNEAIPKGLRSDTATPP